MLLDKEARSISSANDRMPSREACERDTEAVDVDFGGDAAMVTAGRAKNEAQITSRDQMDHSVESGQETARITSDVEDTVLYITCFSSLRSKHIHLEAVQGSD